MHKMKYREERIVQVLDYLASKLVGKRLSKLNALKLVYLADRDHLRKYGMPIIRDEYFAMSCMSRADGSRTWTS